ncbi:hypothetical protein H6G04_35395 [Calothrix membranacea FACHB-236]|nr:hypothetical protein [Calothrix membranacea FACHB-236]
MNKPDNFSESDNLVEQKFMSSWDSIIKFYDGSRMRGFLGEQLADLMVKLVTSMQDQGYNRCLRAGQSLHRLVLSRSPEHGYLGRCHLCFTPEFDIYAINAKMKTIYGLQVTYQVDDNICEEFTQSEIVLTSKIQNLLQRLSEQPIN